MLFTRKAQTSLISFSVGLRMPMKDNAHGRVFARFIRGNNGGRSKKQIVEALDFFSPVHSRNLKEELRQLIILMLTEGPKIKEIWWNTKSVVSNIAAEQLSKPDYEKTVSYKKSLPFMCTNGTHHNN